MINARSRSARARSAALLLGALSSCALDFDISGRVFECPPEMTGCDACNADGKCLAQVVVPIRTLPQPGSVPDQPLLPPVVSHSPLPPDVKTPPERPNMPVVPPLLPDDHVPDGGSPEPAVPDGGTPEPPVSEVCAEFGARASDSLCVNGGEQCFSLGSVLSPALTAWLDPTTLPRDGSRYWCDRSGQRHHALLQPEAEEVAIEPDGRAVGDALARSFLLDGAWLSLSAGIQPALSAGNFAILVAAAALDTPERQAFELFESGELVDQAGQQQSRINLTILPSTAKAEGRITTTQTSLVPTPVVTRSSVYDGGFHLYSLYRRSEVRVLDDVLQLRLNGVLEFRGSSIAIPRALDLSSPTQPPLIGSRSTSNGPSATGRGRIAAVILLRGSIPEDELARLENFLCSALAVCAAPGPTPAPSAPATDAPRSTVLPTED